MAIKPPSNSGPLVPTRGDNLNTSPFTNGHAVSTVSPLAGQVPNGAVNTASQIDVMGAIVRRKFVVILAAVIGAVIGYLHYSSTPPTYQSNLKLQVISLSPPKIVDGDRVLQRVSSTKHQNLLTSELVLNKAFRSGELEQTQMLKGDDSPVGTMKRALKVQPVDKSDDTFILSMTGPVSAELPEILLHIVNAYSDVLAEDSRAIGRESIELIEKMQNQMMVAKDQDEKRFLELVKEVGIDVSSGEETAVNPYAKQLLQLMADQNARQVALRDVLERLTIAKTSIETGDQTQLKVIAIEARQRLGLVYDDRSISANDQKRINGLTAEISRAESKVEELQRAVAKLGLERTDLTRIYGPSHHRTQSLDRQIEHFEAELQVAQQQRELLVKAIEDTQSTENEVINWDVVKEQTERQWINLYLTSLNNERVRLSTGLESLEGELEKVRIEASKVSGDVAEMRYLQRQIKEKGEAIQITLNRLSELNLLSQNYDSFRVRVLDNPGRGYRVEPIWYKSVGIGAILLSLLGCGLALLIDRSDLSFHNPSEIFTRVNVPVIGRIPRLKLNRTAKSPSSMSTALITAHQPNSTGSESFRAIRTALFFEAASNGIKSIMITSPSPGDGKTTVACNLAISIAQARKRVILVDGDLRRPRVHQYFGIESKNGVTDVICGDLMVEEAIQPTFQENLFIMTCGNRPMNPGEMVTSSGFANLLESLRDDYDFIILDSPPVIPVADPATMATLVDGLYMVFRIRRGVKIAAERARETLSRVHARLLGVIVNGLDENPHYNDYAGYQYPYYSGYGRRYQEKMEQEYSDEKN
ncbi:MAG TPA: polysaccharide biosynthesis tyrosine autokinase [Pirellulaceae bacterium]|nr:polysaccharide biosynthesis tyrosine autokinase [Pirellulaceae bacterium]HMO93817.1 polysaccharide biosynthesis tyrosine autokinase [Pirellulaceae bacterium]HMP70676.1 polysaccharide biosynthesis tyrosine autokinase [Pirellulaceae bacterium]